MKRNKFNLSHYRMFTSDMGRLHPIMAVPVLPGDTFQHHTSMLIRLSPLNTPVMHPVTARVHHFFVPNRIMDDGWEDFITGGNDGEGEGTTFPKVTSGASTTSMLAYLGGPQITGQTVNRYPLIAVNRIINEYYLDQDIATPRTDTQNDTQQIAWEKDYFTTARPWTQRGPAVTLPVGSTAPVGYIGSEGDKLSLTRYNSSYEAQGFNDFDSAVAALEAGADNATPGHLLFANLSETSAININDFRTAFALQRYQEARARYGARFVEYLRYLGITPSDARLQRPEYLGGGSARLQFSEVLQTAPNNPGTDQNGIGDLYGHGIAGVRSNKYRKFFEEHGWVITMFSVRPKAVYKDAMHREWLKDTKEDFYQKELVNLGQQEVWQGELRSDGGKTVFGYQDRYDEYRQHPSVVSQDFRTTLSSWSLFRDIGSNPQLNESFIECNPSKRIFQTTSPDGLWCMANHHLVARRMLPKRSRPRIL